MPINLRSRPIEGYISDNAGVVVKNADIIIKEDNPNGSIVVDSVKSDEDGYFISQPIKNGVYDIYESGARVMRQYHSSNPTVLQCYKPNEDNVPSDVRLFSDFIGSSPSYDINYYRYYVQIEPENIDVSTYGNTFPLWKMANADQLIEHEFENIALIHDGFTLPESMLTHTRFDVEYFAPIYTENASHRRIRWGGIPGIAFQDMSKIVLPLDYMSIVTGQSHFRKSYSGGAGGSWSDGSGETIHLTVVASGDPSNPDASESISVGDIIEITLENDTYWAIVFYKNGTTVYGRRWLSSRVSFDTMSNIGLSSTDGLIYGIKIFQGFFLGMENLTSSVGEYFTVQENQAAQNSLTELFSYGNIS